MCARLEAEKSSKAKGSRTGCLEEMIDAVVMVTASSSWQRERGRGILLASCQSGPSRASRRLDAAGLTYAEPVLGDCDLAYGRTASKHSAVCCTLTV